jgi:hypothetical protein
LYISNLTNLGQNFIGPIKDIRFAAVQGTPTYHWPMDEGEGTTFFETEVGGNTYDAILTPGAGEWI